MLRSPPAASPAPSSDVSFHSPSRSPMKNHVSSSVGACSPLRPAIDERSKTTVFASIINTKLQQIRSLLDSAPSPAYVAALLACRRDDETPFDPDLAEDAARLLGKASTVGMTPLQVALMSLDAEDPTPWIARGEGNLVETRREIIRILIEATPICDLDNVTWGISNTVLHLASFLGEQDAVRRLLEKGAKSTARNALNFAPVDVSADEETRSIFLRYAEEEAKRKPRKFHRKPEREWKVLHASKTLTDERRPSYSSPRSRVDVIAKENAAESEDETSLPTIRIVKDEQESLDFTMNRPVTPNSKVPLASSNRVVAPLRLRTQSANPTGIQAEDVLKSPPCRTSTVSSSGILSTTVRESTTTGNLNVLSRDDDKYAAKPPGTPTAEARGMLGSSALVSKNPFRESSSPNKNLAFEGTATEKAARGALEADSLVSKSPFRVRHQSSNENPRNYHLSPSSGMSKSKSIAGGFSQGSPKATNNLPLDKSADGFEQEKMKVQENTTVTDHPVDTLTRPVAEPDTAKPKRREVEESLPTVRDNPFFRRLNAPGAEVGLVPRPQSLIEQWGTAQKLKKEVRRREPAHLMAGGGVISEKEWKIRKMKDKLNAEQTLHADCGENGSRIAPTEVSVQDPIVEPKIESASHAIIEGQNEKPAQTLEEQQEAAEEQPPSTVEELAVKYADVDQMLNTLLEGNPEEIDELSSQEGGSVCIHSDDDADITQSEVDPSEDASSVATDDREADLSPGSDPIILDVKENSDNVTELKEQSVPDNTTKPDEAKVVVQKKIVFPKLVLCKGTTYETRTRVVSGRFCTSAPVPSVSPNAPFTKPIPRPLPMPPSTHGRRARIPQITASVPGQDKFMFTNEQEYACSSAFATGSEGMENGRLYVRLHAMECLNLSKEVLGLAAIGGSATSGSNGGRSIPGDQSFVYCTLACNGNSVCTRPVTITGSKLIIDEEFELVAQPGSALTIKLAVIQPTQGTGGITSLNSSDDLSTKSKHDGLGKKLRMIFHSPSSQNLSGMTHGGTFSSRRGIPEQYGAPQSSLDGAPLASMQIQLNCDRLSEWSSPNAPGNGLNQEWEMITKAAAVVVPEEGSAGYGSRMGSRRAGKLSLRKGKKLWPNESKQNSIGPARNVTIGTVKASVVFWPFADEKRPRNFDQCVKVLLEEQEGGASRWSPVQLKSHLSNSENLPPGIVHRILDVAFKSGCIKWSGTLSMRGADTKFWRRRYLVFYPPHLIALTTPGSLSDPKFSVALDLRQCLGLEAPFTQTQSGDELWQAATNGFRILFPGKSISEVLNKTSEEGMGVSGEDYMVEFSADSMEEAKSLVSALKGAMISLGVSF